MASENYHEMMMSHGGDAGSHMQEANLFTENRNLKSRLRQLQTDLQFEQATLVSVRKKQTGLERERMDIMSTHNEEMSQLESEVARLRSQLEKGEAVRHSLEYELTKQRRDVAHEKRYTAEREAQFNEATEALKEKVGELSNYINKLMEEAEQSQLQHNEEQRQLQSVIAQRDMELGRMQGELNNLEDVRDRLQLTCQQADETVAELDQKLVNVTELKREQAEQIHRVTSDYTHLQSQQECLKKDFESATDRIRQLEENIEAERAAHLETKFNSEIVQLRIRDLESAVELEKNTKLEALTSSDQLNKQLRYCEMYHGDLQRIYDEERRVSQETKDKLEKAEKEYSALSKQLSLELEEKRRNMKDLSDQLESHQKDFNELKQELNKTKRSQAKLEELYNTRMKEVQDVYDNFRLDQPRRPCRKMAASESRSKTPREPDVLVENLKDLLLSYRKKLSETETQVNRLRQQFETASSETRRLNGCITAKDHALKNTQNGMNEARVEMNKLRVMNHQLERDMLQVQRDLDDALRQFQLEQRNNKDIADQCSRLLVRTGHLEQKLNETLMGVYVQLCPDLDQSALTNTPSDELMTLISDQLGRVKADMKWMSEKVNHLEMTAVNKTELAEQLQEAHDEQLRKLSELAEGRTMQWQQHRTQLEDHYNQLLQDIQSRHKKTQTLADQAWEKVRMTGNVQQGLERECHDLRNDLQHRNHLQQALLAACGLLAGALLPLQARHTAMCRQKELLGLQLTRLQAFKKEVQKLTEALKLDHVPNQETLDTNITTPTPLFRLRRYALVVMAAHRLLNLSRGTARMFLSDTVGANSKLVVCTGGTGEHGVSTFTGFGAHRSQYDHFNVEGESRAALWLRSEDLQTLILSCTTDLVHYLSKTKDVGCDSQSVTQLAQSAFQQLVEQLSSVFQGVPCRGSAQLGLRDRGSLVRQLGRGLRNAMGCAEEMHRCLGVMEPSAMTLATLQHQMLDFTRRLHTAEVERRDLRIQVSHLSHEKDELNSVTANSDVVLAERDLLKRQVEERVERSRFQQVCDELNKALVREKDAQKLLGEQTYQMRELQSRVRSIVQPEVNEQRSRQLNQRLQQLEVERDQLQEHVRDAENALRTAARDKESLSAYIKSVTTVVVQLQEQSWQFPESLLDFTSLSLDQEKTSSSRQGPELAACQQLVSAVAQVGQQLTQRLRGLQCEAAANAQHIDSLKQEVAAVCRRADEQFIAGSQPEHVQSLMRHEDSPAHPPNGPINRSAQEFQPLHEDRDVSGNYSTPDMSPESPRRNRNQFHTTANARTSSTGRLEHRGYLHLDS